MVAIGAVVWCVVHVKKHGGNSGYPVHRQNGTVLQMVEEPARPRPISWLACQASLHGVVLHVGELFQALLIPDVRVVSAIPEGERDGEPWELAGTRPASSGTFAFRFPGQRAASGKAAANYRTQKLARCS